MPQYAYKIIFLFLIGLSFGVNAQSKKQLEKKREELSKKIALTNKQIEETKKNQQAKQQAVLALSSQIKLREELIGTISSEIGSLDNTIEERTKRIDQKNKELALLKEDYARAIRSAQRTRNTYDKMIFVFASSDFGQALKRLRYLQEYSAYRREQAEKITQIKSALGVEVKTLSFRKTEKTNLLGYKENEKQRLARDKEEEQNTLKLLQENEKALIAALNKQQNEKRKLDRELDKLIAAEIKKTKTANKGSFKLAPAAKIISDDFAANKGILPWPVEKGTITGRFGKQAHPVLKNIVIENNGIDITTDKDATVRAIFKGTVSSVLVIPGIGKVVVLDHGAYRTIYTQLKEVFVKKGQAVSLKQPLGKCLSDESANKSEAHLEVWQVGENGTQRLNPALWIAK